MTGVGAFSVLAPDEIAWATTALNDVRLDALPVRSGGAVGPSEVEALLYDRSWVTLAWRPAPGAPPRALVRVHDFDPFRRVAWVTVVPGPAHPVGDPLPAGWHDALRSELAHRTPARRALLRVPGTEAAARLHGALGEQAAPVGRLASHRYFAGAWRDEVIHCIDLGPGAPGALVWAEGPVPTLTASGERPPSPPFVALLPSAPVDDEADRPLLTGRHTRLVQLSAANVEVLYRWVADDADLQSLLFQQRLPLPESFLADIERSVFQAYLVEENEAGRPVGLLAVHGLDRVDAHASLHAYLLPEVRRRGWPVEAPLLLISWLFERLRLEKVYLEMDRPATDPVVVALARAITLEARLPHYGDHLGRAVDRYVFAVHRQHARAASEALEVSGRPVG